MATRTFAELSYLPRETMKTMAIDSKEIAAMLQGLIKALQRQDTPAAPAAKLKTEN